MYTYIQNIPPMKQSRSNLIKRATTLIISVPPYTINSIKNLELTSDKLGPPRLIGLVEV